MPNVVNKETGEVKVRVFTYRNIVKKKLTTPHTYQTIIKDFHLERGEKDEVVIVEDRKKDWFEIAQKDVPFVGLGYVLELARKRQIKLSDCMFKDSEAVDGSLINPMDVNGTQKVLQSKQSNVKKLDKLAETLGVSVENLTKSLMDGSFNDLVNKHIETVKQSKEGGKE